MARATDDLPRTAIKYRIAPTTSEIDAGDELLAPRAGQHGQRDRDRRSWNDGAKRHDERRRLDLSGELPPTAAAASRRKSRRRRAAG